MSYSRCNSFAGPAQYVVRTASKTGGRTGGRNQRVKGRFMVPWCCETARGTGMLLTPEPDDSAFDTGT